MKNKLFQLMITLFCCNSVMAQWQQCSGTAGLNMQALMANGVNTYAGGGTGVYISTDTSASFISSNTGNDATGPTRSFAKDNNYIYTCTSQGVFRSSNNGVTWISKSVGLSNLLTSGIIHVNSYLFVVSPSGVFKSTDQGDNWTMAGMNGISIRCITAIQDTLFVGTNSVGIYKSTDFGATWVAINNGLGAAKGFRAIEGKGTTLFAGGPLGTGVYRSTDFGENWSLLSGGLATGTYRGFASNNQLIVAASFGEGIFYSLDNGDNWVDINQGLGDTAIFDVEIDDNYLVAATNLQGVFRISLDELVTGINELLISKNIKIGPNPVVNTLHITTKTSNTTYSVYDNIGTLVMQGKMEDENEMLDVTALSKGLYLIVFNELNGYSFKFIKQ